MKRRKQAITNRCLLAVFWAILVVGIAFASAPTLKQAFVHDFYIGAALNQRQIFGADSSSTALLREHFSSITPENTLKWQAVHPKPDEYDFAAADSFVVLGERLKMFIVGHTLLWHHQTPGWVFKDASGNPANREILLQRLQQHILTVVGRYKGRIHGWDVVNEAIEDDGEMRKTKWLEIIGDDFIQKAFEYARQADPDAQLYYNDFNMWKPGKRQGVVRMIRELQSKGIRVDGIGLQGHWGFDYPLLEEAEASILAFAELGVPVMITEMDVNVLPNPGSYRGADISQNFELQKKLNPYPDMLPDSVQDKLARRYADFFALFHKHRDKISRVTLWGVYDGQSWLNNWPVRGRANYPLLFDRHYQPKPAFHAVINVVRDKEM
ncbi:1,4-beta-xylanase [candidate division KSB1 bacterium RBG_16_48_16]|nr:MAG: 1,4-beta-xylanase [candidate division KSB1 bacterium RBG_16_48_16]